MRFIHLLFTDQLYITHRMERSLESLRTVQNVIVLNIFYKIELFSQYYMQGRQRVGLGG